MVTQNSLVLLMLTWLVAKKLPNQRQGMDFL
jgi:hypothetical protein